MKNTVLIFGFFISLPSIATISKGIWSERFCKTNAEGIISYNQIIAFDEKMILRKKIFKDERCLILESESERSIEIVRSGPETVNIEGVDFHFVEEKFRISLKSPFTTFEFNDRLLSEESGKYASNCINLSGRYKALNAPSWSSVSITQRGCKEVHFSGYVRHPLGTWRSKDTVIPDQRQWKVILTDGMLGSYEAKFEKDHLAKYFFVDSRDDIPEYIEKHFFSTTACKVPRSGKSYYVIERTINGESSLDHCQAYEKILN